MRKSVFFVALLTLLSSFAWALKSATDDIPIYNPQTRALTMAQVCKLVTSGDIDFGNHGQISCRKTPDGVLQIQATNSNGFSLSISAIANDKAVIEYRGWDEAHFYKNDQNERMTLQFVFVTGGTVQKPDGTYVKGSFRGDLLLFKGDQQVRVGYFTR